MACDVTLNPILVTAVDSGSNPLTLPISGSLSGSCVQVFVQLNGGPGVLATVTNGAFAATLTLGSHYQPGDITCGTDNNAELQLTCMSGDPGCQHTQRVGQLECPTCALTLAAMPAQGIVGTLTATPTQVTLQGTAAACDAVEARFIFGTGDPSATVWRSAPVVDGAWQVTFIHDPVSGGQQDYPKHVSCGQTVIIEARCMAGGDCAVTEQATLVCYDSANCPAADITAVIDNECRQNRRLVHFTVTLSNVNDNTEMQGYIDTDDDSIGVPVTIPVSYAPETSGEWTASGDQRQRTFEHTYLPGTYAPTLAVQPPCAVSVALSAVTGSDGATLDALTITACDCTDADIAITVCRVTDPALTCTDTIPDGACTALTAAELAQPLPPGVYVATAVTTPAAAGPVSWSQDGSTVGDVGSDRYCFTLANSETISLNASVNLGLACGAPSDNVTLTGEPGSPPPDDNDPPPDDGDPPPDDNDGCPVDWCRIWLLINIGLSFFAGAAIIITACLLFTTTGVTWPFWVGVGISVALVVASILSFIVWGFVCGRFRRLCGLLVWVHDILLLLSAASGIIGLILLLVGQPPCAIGFFLDFAYYGLLAAIVEAIIRFTGCPLGQNGIIGVIIGIFNWISDALGLNNGS